MVSPGRLHRLHLDPVAGLQGVRSDHEYSSSSFASPPPDLLVEHEDVRSGQAAGVGVAAREDDGGAGGDGTGPGEIGCGAGKLWGAFKIQCMTGTNYYYYYFILYLFINHTIPT